MKNNLDVIVVQLRPTAKQGKNIGAFATVTEAERYIERVLNALDPQGVANGDYSIDAPETKQRNHTV